MLKHIIKKLYQRKVVFLNVFIKYNEFYKEHTLSVIELKKKLSAILINCCEILFSQLHCVLNIL